MIEKGFYVFSPQPPVADLSAAVDSVLQEIAILFCQGGRIDAV